MKKILLFTILILLILLLLTSCSAKPYLFNEPIDEIVSIEIVSAENSLEYTVIKSLSEIEISDFLKQFRNIKFSNYFIGDPMSVNGNAVKILYKSGDYEMICHYWAELVKNGEINYIRKSCNENIFTNLINSYLNVNVNINQTTIY